MDSNGSNFNIYTDGACTNNGRKGAKCSIGIHFPENNEIKLEDISRVLKVPKPTNNVAELTAILESMKKVKGIVYTPICIYTDSEYSLNVLTKWYPKWTEKDKKSKKSSKKNKQDKEEKASKTEAAGSHEIFSSFSDAPFCSAVQAVLCTEYAAPTPIQARSWPPILKGKDLIAVAKTGSGKTLAFLLPALHAIQKQVEKGIKFATAAGVSAPAALIISPTRELTQQIHAEGQRFSKATKLPSLALYGGVPVNEHKRTLKSLRPALIVATPGRLQDLLRQKCIVLRNSCMTVTLDEADRMLDMGFGPSIKDIFSQLPVRTARQTLLFSATWPKAVRALAATFLKEGKGEVEELFLENKDAELEANKSVSQTFFKATDDEKGKKLYDFLCSLVRHAH